MIIKIFSNKQKQPSLLLRLCTRPARPWFLFRFLLTEPLAEGLGAIDERVDHGHASDDTDDGTGEGQGPERDDDVHNLSLVILRRDIGERVRQAAEHGYDVVEAVLDAPALDLGEDEPEEQGDDDDDDGDDDEDEDHEREDVQRGADLLLLLRLVGGRGSLLVRSGHRLPRGPLEPLAERLRRVDEAVDDGQTADDADDRTRERERPQSDNDVNDFALVRVGVHLSEGRGKAAEHGDDVVEAVLDTPALDLGEDEPEDDAHYHHRDWDEDEDESKECQQRDEEALLLVLVVLVLGVDLAGTDARCHHTGRHVM